MLRPLGPPSPAERRRLVHLLSGPPEDAAPALLGKLLVRQRGRRRQAVRIVETEAYLGQGDAAAHASRGRTARTEPLFGPPGTVYVYFIYGMHHCLNIAVEPEGVAGCVLIRAAEPLPGSGLAPLACSGPGRLCRSLALDTRHSGQWLFATTAALYLREGSPPARVVVTPRIGINRDPDRPLRFFDADSPAVSARTGPRHRARGRG